MSHSWRYFVARISVDSGLSVAQLQYWRPWTWLSGNTPICLMKSKRPRSKIRFSLKPARRFGDVSICGLTAQLEHFTNSLNCRSGMPISWRIKGRLTYVFVSQVWWQHVAIDSPSSYPSASFWYDVRARSVAPPQRCLAMPITFGTLAYDFS